VIAEEIVVDLKVALEQIEKILGDMEERVGCGGILESVQSLICR
jgi:hypothetical protein